MKTVSKQLYQTRIKALQTSIHAEGLLIEDPVNLLYLTGLNLSCGKLLLSKTQSLLLVDGRYLEVAQKKAPLPVELDDSAVFLNFSKNNRITTWKFDPQFTSYERFTQLQKLLDVPLSLPCQTSSGEVSPLFESLRVIKDDTEILKMKKSARLLWKGFLFIKQSLKVGITEKELATQFEIFCLKNGAEKLAFEPIIAFGANSAMPHYRAGNRRLKKGDLVLIDIGVVKDHYHSDMTRVLFFKKTDPYLAHLYALVKESQKAALSLCRPGVKIGQLDRAAREVFKREGVEDLFIHSLGHGIGLKTHEFPRIKQDGKDKKTVLKKGMVFTIEPGLYIPGTGGVRYEDTIVITENGYTNFYK